MRRMWNIFWTLTPEVEGGIQQKGSVPILNAYFMSSWNISGLVFGDFSHLPNMPYFPTLRYADLSVIVLILVCQRSACFISCYEGPIYHIEINIHVFQQIRPSGRVFITRFINMIDIS